MMSLFTKCKHICTHECSTSSWLSYWHDYGYPQVHSRDGAISEQASRIEKLETQVELLVNLIKVTAE